MRNRKIILSVGLTILLFAPVSVAQQTAKKKTATADGRIEPLRVINGEMRGRTVSGQFDQGARLTSFTFTFTKAEAVNGRLQLRGDFALEGGGVRLSDQVIGTVAGAIAEAENPWPQAREEQRKDDKKSKEGEKNAGEQLQGREARNPESAGQLGELAQSTQDTARKTPPAPGEKTEQTQSLYAQSETGTGCGVMFLKLMLPNRLRARMRAVAGPLQLGMVLKAFDNEGGEEISKQLCRLARTSGNRYQSASLDHFNRLLVSSK